MAELKNIRIAVSGIYEYAIYELDSLRLSIKTAPDWVEKKDIYKVYRPANVLNAACQKFKLLPLTHYHPQIPVDSSNFRKLVIGYTGENPFIDYLEEKDEIGIRSNVLLYDEEAQSAYERGERQLSPGYEAVFEWQKGTSPQNEEYDIIMKEIIKVNHLALLPSGRGGEAACVLDSKIERKSIFEIVQITKDKKDANGMEHSDKSGQFVSKQDNSRTDSKADEETLSEEEKRIISNLLKNTAVPMPPPIAFNDKNYDSLFKNGIDSPIEHIKLGEHQKEKLKAKNRENILASMLATLKEPSTILKAVNGTRVYVKSFIKDNKQRNIISVIIDRDSMHISISTHERREAQILKKACAILYKKGTGDHGTVRPKDVAERQKNATDKAAQSIHIDSITIEDEKRKSIFEIVQITKDKKDANGMEHSDKSGQFVSKQDNSRTDRKTDDEEDKNKKTNDEYRRELKAKLKDILKKDLPNEATGITASISSEGLNKMMSAKAISKSVNNGFTLQEHFEAVGNVVQLFKDAKMIASYPDEKHNDPNVTIKRFVAQDTLKSGKKADFLLTLKESFQNGHRIYSLELDEINKASLRWHSTKDGKAVFQVYQTLTTGSPTEDTIPRNLQKRKSIFEIVQGSIFDLYSA